MIVNKGSNSMPIDDIKIETVEDYSGNSRQVIEWCKKNLEGAKKNPALGRGAPKKLKKKLYEGFFVKNKQSQSKVFRRFNYPEQYIKNVLNKGNRTWNKWVILAALEYTEEEHEDINNISVFMEENKTLLYGKSKKKSAIQHIADNHKLKKKSKFLKPKRTSIVK